MLLFFFRSFEGRMSGVIRRVFGCSFADPPKIKHNLCLHNYSWFHGVGCEGETIGLYDRVDFMAIRLLIYAVMGDDFVVMRGQVSYLVYILEESDSGGTKDPSKRRENTRMRHLKVCTDYLRREGNTLVL